MRRNFWRWREWPGVERANHSINVGRDPRLLLRSCTAALRQFGLQVLDLGLERGAFGLLVTQQSVGLANVFLKVSDAPLSLLRVAVGGTEHGSNLSRRLGILGATFGAVGLLVCRSVFGLQWHGFTPVYGFTDARVNRVYGVYK